SGSIAGLRSAVPAPSAGRPQHPWRRLDPRTAHRGRPRGLAHRSPRFVLRGVPRSRGPGRLSALDRGRRGGPALARGSQWRRQGESPRQGLHPREPHRPTFRRRRPRECRWLHHSRDARAGHHGATRSGACRAERNQFVGRRQQSGILPVEKGPGVTSFQVVAQLRRLLHASKIGHGGTLDPEATGVLPILIGEATKLTPYLTELDKEYVATVRLGVTTTTQDMTGEVTETRPVPSLD